MSTFSIGAGGALTQVGSPVLSGNSNSTTNSEPYGVTVSPNGQNLYVANYQSGTVSTFSIGAGGVLTQQGTGITSGSAGPSWVAVSPGGQNLYVTNYTAGTVSTFSIGSGGAITTQGSPALSGSTVGSGPQGVAVSPNGRNLYVTNESEGTVSSFSIGAGGALTAQAITGPISGTTVSAQPFGVAVSPGGENLYVANFALGSVSTFSIGADGALAVQGPPVLSGSSPSSGSYEVAVSPSQGPTAAYGAAVSPRDAASTFSAQASLAGSAPIATYAWQFGDGTRAPVPW